MNPSFTFSTEIRKQSDFFCSCSQIACVCARVPLSLSARVYVLFVCLCGHQHQQSLVEMDGGPPGRYLARQGALQTASNATAVLAWPTDDSSLFTAPTLLHLKHSPVTLVIHSNDDHIWVFIQHETSSSTRWTWRPLSCEYGRSCGLLYFKIVLCGWYLLASLLFRGLNNEQQSHSIIFWVLFPITCGFFLLAEVFLICYEASCEIHGVY